MMKGQRMMRPVRTFLLVEAATFLVAALSHFGVPVEGYEHQEAAVAESVIALVLLTGVWLGWSRPAWARAAGIGAQGFALVGTLVGLFTIAIGYRHPNSAYYSFDRVSQVASILVLGPVVAAAIVGLF
jgi:hypothetical protein